MDVFEQLGYTTVMGRTKLANDSKHIGLSNSMPLYDFDSSLIQMADLDSGFPLVYSEEIFPYIVKKIRESYPDIPVETLNYAVIRERMRYLYSRDLEDYTHINKASGIDGVYGTLTANVTIEILGQINARLQELSSNSGDPINERRQGIITTNQLYANKKRTGWPESRTGKKNVVSTLTNDAVMRRLRLKKSKR